MRLIDLTGQRFGRLTVIKRAEDYMQPNGTHKTQWLCRCDCGNYRKIISYDLRKRRKSCGCCIRETLPKVNKRYNRYNLTGEYGIGYTRNNEMFFFDKEDYDLIKDYSWCYNSNGYVITTIHGKCVWMHRFVKPINNNNEYIDHINHIKHDNRKNNLRVATSTENHANIGIRSNNKSGVTGVVYDNDRNKWRAYINIFSKQIYLGRYNSKPEAEEARVAAERKYFGEYSYRNSLKIATQNEMRKE